METHRSLSDSADHRPVATARRMCLVLAVTSGLAISPMPAAAAPAAPVTAQDAGDLVAAKAHDLERLTEQFDTARDRLGRQQATAQAAAEALTQTRVRLAAARRQVRGIARSTYADGRLSSVRVLLTSDSADDVVQRLSTLDMIAERQGAVLGQAATAADSAAKAEATARKAAADARAGYEDADAERQQLQAEIDEYRAEFDRLSAQERLASVAMAEGRASRDERPAPTAVGRVVAGTRTEQIAVDTALAQLGKPYVWGAAGPDSFDCSGLVLFAYEAAGVSMPHSSALQATMGRPVTRAELQPGDLVAFYSPVSHIGIYIGNGQMVHAPTSGDVVRVAGIDAVGSITAMRRIAG